MGLAILPGRLQEEMKETAAALCSADPKTALEQNPLTAKHSEWAIRMMEKEP